MAKIIIGNSAVAGSEAKTCRANIDAPNPLPPPANFTASGRVQATLKKYARRRRSNDHPKAAGSKLTCDRNAGLPHSLANIDNDEGIPINKGTITMSNPEIATTTSKTTSNLAYRSTAPSGLTTSRTSFTIGSRRAVGISCLAALGVDGRLKRPFSQAKPDVWKRMWRDARSEDTASYRNRSAYARRGRQSSMSVSRIASTSITSPRTVSV